MIRRLDELQNLTSYSGNIDWEEFFDAMDLTEEQREKRERVADKLFWVFAALFVLAQTTQDEEICVWWLDNQLTMVVQEYGVYNSYSVLYIDKFTREYVDVTFRNDGEYFVSDDRALLGALNEANAIVGYEELEDAIADGATYKIWVTEKDNKVRPTHKVMNGKKIPIDDFFEVGGERLLYPRDEVNCGDLAELANCRCHLSFE